MKAQSLKCLTFKEISCEKDKQSSVSVLRYFSEVEAVTVDCHHAMYSEVGAPLGTTLLQDEMTEVPEQWHRPGNEKEEHHVRDENTLCVQTHLLEKTESAS
jgi:hypothetical protein